MTERPHLSFWIPIRARERPFCRLRKLGTVKKAMRSTIPGARGTSPETSEYGILSIGDTAAMLAEQSWSWARESVGTTLAGMGFLNSQSVGHRVTYVDQQGRFADLYCDGEHVDCVEITILAFTDVEALTDLEYEDQVDNFYAAFLAATKEIVSRLGNPVFSDGATATDFPDDQDAVWLSLWILPKCRLFLQQKHEDRELPIRLCLVVDP